MQKKTKKMTRASRQNIGYAYIAIWIIGFLVFKFYPFMSSLFYSFTNYNLFKESVENIGFANYEKIVDTAKYLKSYIVTLSLIHIFAYHTGRYYGKTTFNSTA